MLAPPPMSEVSQRQTEGHGQSILPPAPPKIVVKPPVVLDNALAHSLASNESMEQIVERLQNAEKDGNGATKSGTRRKEKTGKAQTGNGAAAAPGANEIIYQGQNVVKIASNIVNLTNLRRLDVAFNALKDLNNVDQFPSLRILSAYANQIEDVEAIRDTPRLEVLHLQQVQHKYAYIT